MNKTYLLIILSILSAIAPISIATYIPAIPDMAKYFNVDISDIEFSLSIFLLGLSIGQLFGGTLSDRKGRKFSSLIGLIGFSFFSFLIIFSVSIYELWIYRFFEAFFGGLIIVNATAIVKDLFSGKDAAKFFSLLGSVRSIIPIVAPTIGSFLLFFASWQGIFIFLTMYSLLIALLVFKDLEETFTYKKTNIIHSFMSVLMHKKAIMMIFVLSLGFSSMFAIITKSSFIYIEYFHVNINYFPFYYALNVMSIMFFALINIKFLNFFTQVNILKIAVSTQIVFATLFLLFYEDLTLYSAIGLIVIYMGMNGLIFGNATALILENFSSNAGVASSIIGVFQFGLAAIISSIIVSFHGQSLLSIGVGMFAISSVSFIILKNINFNEYFKEEHKVTTA